MEGFEKSTIDAKVMERARNQLKASTIFARDSIQGMAAILSQLVMIGLPPEWFNQWPVLVDAVTPEQITQAVRETCTDRTAVTGVLLPSKTPLPYAGAKPVSSHPQLQGNIQ